MLLLHFDFSPLRLMNFPLRKLRSYGANKNNIFERAVLLSVVGAAIISCICLFHAQLFLAVIFVPAALVLFAVFGFLVFSWADDIDDISFALSYYSFPILKVRIPLVEFILTFIAQVLVPPPRFRLV